MFEHVVRKGGLKENEARWFFQQLIVGVDYVHKMVRRQGSPQCLLYSLLLLYSVCLKARQLMSVLSYAGRREQGHQVGEHPLGWQPQAAGEDL